MCSADIFLALIAILFPPIAVWIKSGICTADSLINIALCCLGYIPGLIHAWYIIARNPDPASEYEPIADSERAHHRVVYVHVTDGRPDEAPQPKPAPPAPMAPPTQSSAPGPSSGETAPPPPSYSDAVKSDNKVQTQD